MVMSVRVWVRADERFEVSGPLGAFSVNQKKTEKKGKTKKSADAIMHNNSSTRLYIYLAWPGLLSIARNHSKRNQTER